MRPREDELIDPEIAEQLDAIDATLAGDPVAPRFAELAELALLISVARPEGMRPEFGAELDRRVAARFGPADDASVVAGGSGAAAGGRSRWRGWSLRPVLGTAVAALAAVVVAMVLVTSGSGTGAPRNGGVAAHGVTGSTTTIKAKSAPISRVATSARSINGTVQTIHGGGGTKAAPALAAPVESIPAPEKKNPNAVGSVVPVPPSSGAAGSGAGLESGAVGSTGPGVGSSGSVNSAAPTPVPDGRKIIQSSILQLGAPAKRIDAVAQGVFDVIGAVNGIVDRSNVASTGGPAASAQFQLRVPSSSLSLALTDLSRLRYAHVISRTDNTQDVNPSYVSTQRQIAQAQAALTRLRTQLAAATIGTEIAGLKAQIAGEKATLARAQDSLQGLNRQINYSRLQVSIQATTTTTGAGVTTGGGGGFGLHKAGHDALRVLEVTAGAALIALAVLVPVALLAALGWWLSGNVQRRRRERALDMA